jgi:hypothetical protein
MKSVYIFLSIIIFQINGFAQNDTIKKPKLTLDFPIIDAPYLKYAAQTNANYCSECPSSTIGFNNYLASFSNPSMEQSLAISKNYYSLAHYGLQSAFKMNKKTSFGNKLVGHLSIVVFDLLSSNAPFGNTWVHEEFHRAAMAIDYTSSYNEVYDFKYILNPFEAPSVTNVNDEALSRFKKRSPINFIRIKSAGIEGETLLPNVLQNDNFFFKQNLPNSFSYLLHYANSAIYLRTSANGVIDPNAAVETDIEKDIAKRDFAGVDFYAWIYDMNRPNEPYENRGIHPTGFGIKRYIQVSDLTNEEMDYLKSMGNRQLLNFISPMNFFINSIKVNDNLRFNFGLQHFLTSFGDDTGGRLLVNYKTINLYFAYHNFQNKNHTFPAIEARIINYPVQIKNKNLFITANTTIGVQPKAQSFLSNKNEFLGQVGIQIEYPISKNFLPYLTFNTKTNGWIAGNPFLENKTSIQLGLKARIF